MSAKSDSNEKGKSAASQAPPATPPAAIAAHASDSVVDDEVIDVEQYFRDDIPASSKQTLKNFLGEDAEEEDLFSEFKKVVQKALVNERKRRQRAKALAQQTGISFQLALSKFEGTTFDHGTYGVIRCCMHADCVLIILQHRMLHLLFVLHRSPGRFQPVPDAGR